MFDHLVWWGVALKAARESGGRKERCGGLIDKSQVPVRSWRPRWVQSLQFGRDRMSHQVRSSLKADEDRNGKTLTISRGLFAFMLPPLNLP